MDLLMAFSIVLIILSIGDVISTKTKAFVPSVFVSALLFLLGYWTFLRVDIVEVAGFAKPIVYLSMYLLVTHMGTLLTIKELVAQWKTILIALAGIIGICIMTMTIGRMLFGFNTAVVATPPLTGGIVAAIIMSEAATGLNLPDLAVLAIITYVMQGFVGYPITAMMLRKEGNRLLDGFRSGTIKSVDTYEVKEIEVKKKLIPPVPKKYLSTYLILAKLGVTALAAIVFAGVLKDYAGINISAFVFCLFFGVIAQEIGFVEQRPLNTSGSFGFLITILMAFIFSNLSKATPAMLAQIAIPLGGIIISGVFGMGVLSMVVGKALGYTKEMSFAVALTALYGFPPNYVLTEEAAKALATTDEENEFLMESMLPKMLVGGFTTVTIVSVVIAGIFVNFLK